MRPILIVPWGRTEWDEQHRLTGDADIPLSAAGAEQVRSRRAELAALQPVGLFCGPEDAAHQTADLLAEALALRVKVREGLHEWNLGTWEGMAESEFRERFPKVHRQWRDEPGTVCPPEGETLADVAGRLQEDFRKLIRRVKAGPIVIVTGPMAAATLTLLLRGEPIEGFWTLVDELQPWWSVTYPRRA